jgi:hypothetical protein
MAEKQRHYGPDNRDHFEKLQKRALDLDTLSQFGGSYCS